MMQPTASACRIHAENHIRSRDAYQSDVIADDLVSSPFRKRFFDAERVTEVDGAGEILLARVEAVHRFELFGAEHG
jgi:hypothetical protein